MAGYDSKASASASDIEEPLLDENSDKQQKSLIKSPSSRYNLEGGFGYNYENRPCRDIVFAIIFLVFAAATFGLGIFSIVHRNKSYRWTQPAHYERNQSRCTTGTTLQLDLTASTMLLNRLRLQAGTVGDKFGAALILCLVATLLLSVPIILGLVWLLRNYTKQLVYVSLPLFILIPIAVNVLWFVACTKSSECQESLSLPVRILFFVFIFLVCGIVAWIIFSNFARVELTIQILRAASQALYQNWSLLVVVPSLSLLLLLFYVPTAFFLVFSYTNGKYSPHPDLRDRPDLPCGRGTVRECCVWKPELWVPAYMALAIFSLLWTTFVVAQAKVYTVSGTIAQWYFSKEGLPTLRAMRRSLGHAFSTSFGTVCLSGLVFAFIRLIRSSVDRVNVNQDREGLSVSLLNCCYDWCLRGIHFLTKFTIDFAAITGESFCSSAYMTYDLLKRNLLSTVFVEVISTRLLSGVMFVVSVIYAVVVWGILEATKIGRDAYTLAFISWALLGVVLLIFTAVINIVVDTVYICYAMDKDKNVVSRPEAHEVYVLLPVSQEDRPSLAYRDPDV